MAAPITLATRIDVSPDAIFQALSTGAGLSSFWTTDSQAEPVVGSVSRFGFPTGSGRPGAGRHLCDRELIGRLYSIPSFLLLLQPWVAALAAPMAELIEMRVDACQHTMRSPAATVSGGRSCVSPNLSRLGPL